MEDVLALYHEPYDPDRPVVCFDEHPTELIAEVHDPMPANPGTVAKQDYHYDRQGTKNLFLASEQLDGWRTVTVTDRRTTEDWVTFIKALVDEHYADVESVAAAEIDSIPPERAATLVLRQFEGDAFDALERRLHRNQSLREAHEYTTPEDVPDGTTLWRAFDALEPTDLRDCLQAMCAELLDAEEPGGTYAIVDGTHVEAWANTRQEIEDGAVKGASWGKHEGSFYGYTYGKSANRNRHLGRLGSFG